MSRKIYVNIMKAPTPKQINDYIESTAKLGSVNHIGVDSKYKDYLRAHCYRPIKLRLFDSYKGHFVERYVPCGHCYHCQETKQNEWVTRLYAHLEDFKYCYFVTLTYRSFDSKRNPFEQFLFDYLDGAYFHFDNLNHKKRYCYRPSILVKRHYQNFLKRLRQRTGIQELTFFGSGEYGKKHGSPHWHFLLFSHEPIKPIDIRRSWGLSLSLDDNDTVRIKRTDKQSSFCSFGRVQIDDLVANGTISNKLIRVDGYAFNARACFSYVAKYVCKKEFNHTRVDLCYNDFIKDFLTDYEKNSNDISISSLQNWRKSCQPFVAVSRGCPISSLWVARHLTEMANGQFMPPPLQVTGFVVPTYFRRKASESLTRLRVISPRGSLSKGNLVELASQLASSVGFDFIQFSGFPFELQPEIYKPLSKLYSSYTAHLNVDSLLNSPDCFVDIVNKHRFIILTIPENDNIVPYVYEYSYNRKCSAWRFVHRHDLKDWCLFYLSSMPQDFMNHFEQSRKSDLSQYYLEKVYDYYSEFDRLETLVHMPDVIEDENEQYFTLKNVSRYQNSKL